MNLITFMMKDGQPCRQNTKKRIEIKIWSRRILVSSTIYKELIDLRIKFQDGYFKFLIPKDRLSIFCKNLWFVDNGTSICND